MRVYLICLVLVLLFSIIPVNSAKAKRDILILSLLPVFLIIALHGDWSGDYVSYYFEYHYMHSLGLSQLLEMDLHSELGFRLLCWLIPSHQLLIVIQALWISVFLYCLFYNFIPKKYWPVAFAVIFFSPSLLLGDISAVRNGIAVGFFLVAIYYLSLGKKWAYVALVVAGGFFHTTAFFFLPLVFLNAGAGNRSIKIWIFFIVIVGFISLLTPKSYFKMVSVILDNQLFSRYKAYVEDASGMVIARGLSNIFTLFTAVVLLIEFKKDYYTSSEILMIQLGLIWAILSWLPTIITARFMFYMCYPMIASLTIVAGKSKNVVVKYGCLAMPLLYYANTFNTYRTTDFFMEHWLQYHLFF